MTAPPPITRAAVDQACKCQVCQVARTTLDYAALAAKHSNPLGAPRVSPISPPARVLPFCSKCFCQIGQGKSHVCDKNKKSANLSNIVRNTSTRSKSKITASGLKNIADEQGTSTRGGTLKLQTGSKPIPVVIGAPQIKPKQAKFSHENLKRLQAATNLSDKSMKYVFSEAIKIFSWYILAIN